MKRIVSIGAIFFLFATLLHTAEPSHKSILDTLTTHQIEFVDFLFTDILGTLRSLTLPVHQVPSALKNGLCFDGSSVPGCTTIQESDMLLWPDLNTFAITPTKSYKTARIICDIYRSIDIPYEADPRYILKKTIAQAETMGYTFYVGPELEFFLFHIDEQGNLTPCDTAKYFEAESCETRDAQKKELLRSLLAHGVRIEKLHHEVAPGQHEVSIRYGDALTIADQIVLCKHAIKSFAKQHDMHATFMPKPLAGQNGSGMHVHFSLFDNAQQRNIFYDANAFDLLSDLAHHFIAGVLEHTPALCAVFNPSINSYKRLVPGHEAPVYRCWSCKNRSAMIRVPQIEPSQSSGARAEIRSPDGLANPYLVFAGLLKAGIDGIQKALSIPSSIDTNLYRTPLNEIYERGISTLPTSLEDSLNLFESDSFIHDLFGQHALHEYVKAKYDEIRAFKKTITHWEIERYL